jgi:hypothetical protein
VAQDRNDRKSRRQQKKRDKQPIGQRIGKQIGDQARAIGDLSDVVVNRPRELPDRAHGWFRRWFAKVWRVRGGGLYAFGFAISFIIYEVRMLIEDFSGDSDFAVLLDGQIVNFIVNFFLESLANTIQALLWPLSILKLSPLYGAVGLALAYLLFSRVLKKPIEAWLFADETVPDQVDVAKGEQEKGT